MSNISYDKERSTWLLEMLSSCYGMALDGPGRLPRHVHWGPMLDHPALSAMAAEGDVMCNTEAVAWADEKPLEYVGWGGRRYDEPSLKLDFSDGTRGIEWELVDSQSHREGDTSTLVLVIRDLAYPLSVDLCYRVFDESDVLERWARVVSTGNGGAFIVRQAHSANWWLPERNSWRLNFLHGGWGSETHLGEVELGQGKVVLESRRGTTSHQVQPFFALDTEGRADEDTGEIWSGQIAWSGSWKLVTELTPGGHVHISGGWNDFDAPLELRPGKDLVLPVFAGLYSRGGFGAMSRAWHAYELSHVLNRPSRSGGSPSFPAPAKKTTMTQPGSDLPRVRPVLYNSWYATSFAVSYEGQSRLAELAAEMGVELFVVDDGWFAGRLDDRSGLGDWSVDLSKFPQGLDQLIDRIKSLGMHFGIWMEPEMVNPDSDLYRAHPDWVFHFTNRSRTEQRNQLVLNLARDDVADWVYGTVHHLLSDYAIDFVKWDMNRHFSEPGWPSRVGANPERAWIVYVTNLYAILDRLREAHPDVEFESCSGGGGRVDLGILSRTGQAWTSDNTDAWDRILIQEGFSYIHAPLAMMAWVTDSPDGLTDRSVPLAYRFHVAMAGSLGIGGNIVRWSPDQRREAKQMVGEYKAIRNVVQHGKQYRLASTRNSPLGAVEYISRDDNQVVVLAWSGVRHYGSRPGWLRLTALDRSARYRDRKTAKVHLGVVLEELGLPLPAELDFMSMMVHLERVGSAAR
jgi:alpha-galactosidase